MARRDLISGTFFLLLGGYFVLGALQFPIWDRYGPGAGFFPLVLGMVFMVLCGILLVRVGGGFVRKRQSRSQSQDAPSFVKKGRFALCLGFFLGFYLFFESAGFLITVFVYLLGILLLLGKRSLGVSLLIASVTTVLVYLAFVYALGVQLPLGILRDFFYAFMVR